MPNHVSCGDEQFNPKSGVAPAAENSPAAARWSVRPEHAGKHVNELLQQPVAAVSIVTGTLY
jgi:hypothetical protein